MRFKVCVCGVPGVGKSTLVARALQRLNAKEMPAAILPTISYDFSVLRVDSPTHGPMALELCDTAGQERLAASIAPVFWRGAAGIAFVYDLTDRKSYDALELWIQQAGANLRAADAQPEVMVFGNKLDLAAAGRVVPRAEAARRCADGGYSFAEVSALDGDNVAEAFAELIERLAARHAARHVEGDKPGPGVALGGGRSLVRGDGDAPWCAC